MYSTLTGQQISLEVIKPIPIRESRDYYSYYVRWKKKQISLHKRKFRSRDPAIPAFQSRQKARNRGMQKAPEYNNNLPS